MERGIVKWFNEDKGFGFVKGDDGKDYFVHKSDIEDMGRIVEKGQRVEFEASEGDKGLAARNVRLLVETE